MAHGFFQNKMLSDTELRECCLDAVRRYHEQQQDMLARHLAQLRDQHLRAQVTCQLTRVADDTALCREQCKEQPRVEPTKCTPRLPAQTKRGQRDELCRIALARAQFSFEARVSHNQQQSLHEMD